MVQNYLHFVSSADQIKYKGQNWVHFALCDGHNAVTPHAPVI